MNEREIFTAASQIEDRELRANLLATVCKDDAALLQRIESLLRASEHAEDLIEPSQRALQHLSEEEQDEGNPIDCRQAVGQLSSVNKLPRPGVLQPGTQIGPYQIQQLLGEGGMGVVYAAKQSEPVKRQVALKILRPGDTSRNILARFEQERHALSMMEHSGIARILDAGSTADGLPFFVMELVKGIPINQYCDQENLSPQERLQLFIPVCAAVQHAHQKGIIHRDLKPSNILVALYDGKPVPKVIDFGVAKAIGPRLSETTVYTEVGSVVGTLEYMAPEQAELNNLDIDTRADIYSLGVVLYELLTGSPPFSRQQLRSAAFDEMLRIIREVEPPKPSTKVSSSDEAASVAAHRKLEPKQLAKALSGDLDWVVMKSLAKERTHRYQTVGEFAADIHRFLNIEPVAAGPPSFAYRARRFLKRNRILSLATLMTVLAVVAGVVGTSIGMVQARTALAGERQALKEKTESLKAEEQARNEAELASQKTLQALDSLTGSFTTRWMSRQNELSADDRKFLKDILVFYEDASKTNSGTKNSKQIRVAGFHKTANLHTVLGNSQEALESYQLAARFYQDLSKQFPDMPEYIDGEARCLRPIAQILSKQGNRQAAEDSHRRSIELLSGIVNLGSALPSTHIEHIESLTDFASLLHRHGKNAEAERVFQQAEEAFHTIEDKFLAPVERQSLYASMLQIRCYFFRELGRLKEAFADGQKAIELATALIESGVDQAQTRREICSLHTMLGTIHQSRGEFELAQSQFRAASVAARSLVARYPLVPAHRAAVAESHRMLGANYFFQRNYGQSIEEYNQAKIISRRILDDFPDELEHQYNHAELCNVMGLALKESGQLDGAERELQESVQLKKKVVEKAGETLRYRQSLAMSLHNLANTHNKQREFEAAIQCHHEAITIRENLFNKNPEIVGLALDLGGSHCDFGNMLVNDNRIEEGLKQLDRAVEILEKLVQLNPQQNNARVFLRNARQNRGVAHLREENWQESLADIERATELDDGSNRVRYRQQRLICVCHLDPVKGIAAAEDLLKLDDAGPSDQFAAARAFAQISGTHDVEPVRKNSAERAIQLLQSLNDAGIFRDPAAANLDQYIEFRYLSENPAFKALIEAIKKQLPPQVDSKATRDPDK
jgi:eukaryotic-like serine/threonine-protein kinase